MYSLNNVECCKVLGGGFCECWYGNSGVGYGSGDNGILGVIDQCKFWCCDQNDYAAFAWHDGNEDTAVWKYCSDSQ